MTLTPVANIKGPQGIQGEPGQDGADGAAGPPGTDGVDGAGGLNSDFSGNTVGGTGAAGNNNGTAFGISAHADGAGAVAIGSGAQASAPGSTAIGRDSASHSASTAVQDEMKLGTDLTTVYAGKDLKTLAPDDSGPGVPWQLGGVTYDLGGSSTVAVKINGDLVSLAVAGAGTPGPQGPAGADGAIGPAGPTGPAGQLGAVVAAAVTFDATQYVEVTIGGVLIKLAICT